MAHRNPIPTVDIIIQLSNGIVLIQRKNPPRGWALPGGFIDYDETAEHAAQREALEETRLAITDLRQFHVYSDPNRDPRHHSISVVFTARGHGRPQAADDASMVKVFDKNNLPEQIVFDHRMILKDYFEKKY